MLYKLISIYLREEYTIFDNVIHVGYASHDSKSVSPDVNWNLIIACRYYFYYQSKPRVFVQFIKKLKWKLQMKTVTN